MTIDFRNWLTCIATVAITLILSGILTAQVESFDLASLDGSKLTVKPTDTNEAKLTVLFFTGIECPLAKLYAPRVAKLAKRYSSSVRFFGISSNQQDSSEEFKQFQSFAL